MNIKKSASEKIIKEDNINLFIKIRLNTNLQ